MMKIEWKERVYNNFVGTMSERDEYQKQEINKNYLWLELVYGG